MLCYFIITLAVLVLFVVTVHVDCPVLASPFVFFFVVFLEMDEEVDHFEVVVFGVEEFEDGDGGFGGLVAGVGVVGEVDVEVAGGLVEVVEEGVRARVEVGAREAQALEVGGLLGEGEG